MIVFGTSCIHELTFENNKSVVCKVIAESLAGIWIDADNSDVFGDVPDLSSVKKELVGFQRQFHPDKNPEGSDLYRRLGAICGALHNAARNKNCSRLVYKDGCLLAVAKDEDGRSCKFGNTLPLEIVEGQFRVIERLQILLETMRDFS